MNKLQLNLKGINLPLSTDNRTPWEGSWMLSLMEFAVHSTLGYKLRICATAASFDPTGLKLPPTVFVNPPFRD